MYFNLLKAKTNFTMILKALKYINSEQGIFFYTSFKNSSEIFCESCKHFKATNLFFHVAEYTVAKPPLPICLILLNWSYGINSIILLLAAPLIKSSIFLLLLDRKS